jgi:PAT family beta-lactamase induction signal transducer AmpG
MLAISGLFKPYFNRVIFTVVLSGVISGISLAVTGQTLNFWLASSGIDVISLGLLSLVTLPYAINFVWAPALDTIRLPIITDKLGRRRSWLLVLQICIQLSIIALSFQTPGENLLSIVVLSALIAFFASSQDIALNAYRVKIVSADSTGTASGAHIFGYRMGMLIASSGCIYLSVYLDWQIILLLIALILLLLSFCLLIITRSSKVLSWAEEETVAGKGDLTQSDQNESSSNHKYKIIKFFRDVFAEIGDTKQIITLLSFLILYRIGDNYLNAMIHKFLLEFGFGATEIASIGKFFGIFAALLGGLIGGSIMQHISMKQSLLIFGLIHSLAHMLFLLLVYDNSGSNILLAVVITAESVTSGMAMTAFIALITGFSAGSYSGTKYSLLSATMGLSRAIFPTFSGWVVSKFNWEIFFVFITLISLVSLPLIAFLNLKSDGYTENLSE